MYFAHARHQEPYNLNSSALLPISIFLLEIVREVSIFRLNFTTRVAFTVRISGDKDPGVKNPRQLELVLICWFALRPVNYKLDIFKVDVGCTSCRRYTYSSKTFFFPLDNILCNLHLISVAFSTSSFRTYFLRLPNRGRHENIWTSSNRNECIINSVEITYLVIVFNEK